MEDLLNDQAADCMYLSPLSNRDKLYKGNYKRSTNFMVERAV